MKPRNQLERTVVALSAKLPYITLPQEHYAYEHCFKHEAVVRSKNNNEYTCLECGHVWQGDSMLAGSVCGVVCPHCGRKLEVSVTRRWRKQTIVQTFQVITTAGDFQVTRTYHVRQSTAPKLPAEYGIDEVCQIFQSHGRRDVIVARPRKGSVFYNDLYCYDKPMSIKDDNQYSDYKIHATVIYPRRKVLPMLIRNGYCKEMYNFHPTNTFECLWNSTGCETIAKAKRFDIWHGLHYHDIRDYWAQIKMLIRHDYHPSDFSLWKDTIRMARDLGLDTHSPKYVCPSDLTTTHDQLLKRLEAKRRKEEEQAKREEQRKKRNKEKSYKKHMGALLAVVIKSNDLTIVPLQNYDDYLNEGDAMHHCVETYWGDWKSLILSVRSNGQRLATVELSVKDFKIQQCRAACNQQPERYDEICSVINSHQRDFLDARLKSILTPKI